jgi:hypothetical protein
LNKSFIPWLIFIVSDFIFLSVLIFTKCDFSILGFMGLVLGLLSTIAIFMLDKLNFRIKVSMAFGLSFKYYVFGIFSFLIPLFEPSETPMFIFVCLYMASIIGAPIALHFAKKNQKNS